MTPSYVDRLIASAFGLRAKAFGKVDKKRLFDDAENNIGNAQIVVPSVDPTVLLEQNPPRIIALDALSPTGQMITVVLTNTFLPPEQVPFPFNQPPLPGSFGGPVVGIVEFGNGAIFTRVEADIPMGRVDFGTLATNPEDGGTAISVPAGTLRVYGRNDGNLIPSTIAGLQSGQIALASTNNLPFSETFPIAPARGRPTLVKAFGAYFTRPTVRPPSRTVYLWSGGRDSVGTPAEATFGSNTFPDAYFTIPPFARAARILRFSTAAPQFPGATIFFNSPEAQQTPMDQGTVGAGTNSPFFDVPGNATWFAVTTLSPVSKLAVEFLIGF